MNSSKIVQMRVGYTNVNLIVNGNRSILIDTGKKGILKSLCKKLEQYNLTFCDLKLIILTHTHFDHTGDLKELASLSKAKVVVNSFEKDDLENGTTKVPKGTNLYTKFITSVGSRLFPGYASPQPYTADIIVEEKMSLLPWGIDGMIIHTPGHSKGSQSVLIGNKLFAGDLFFNIFPGTVFPPFADNPKQLLQSWKNIFESGVKEIYPSHGSRFKVERAYESYNKWKKKLKIID